MVTPVAEVSPIEPEVQEQVEEFRKQFISNQGIGQTPPDYWSCGFPKSNMGGGTMRHQRGSEYEIKQIYLALVVMLLY